MIHSFLTPLGLTGMTCANWLSREPGFAVCGLHGAAYCLLSQNPWEDKNQLLILLGITVSFLLNKVSLEERRNAALVFEDEQRAHDIRVTAQIEEKLHNVRQINQVVLETLRPSRNPGIGPGVVGELMERLDYLQATMPGVDHELAPCKALLKELQAEFAPEPDSPDMIPKKGPAKRKV